jgi:ligand-binding sensor domain-containing protein
MLPADARNTLTYSEKEGLKGENILSLVSDNKGRLFIGTASNNLLMLDANTIKKIPKLTISGNAIDYEMILDSKGNLYSSAGYQLTLKGGFNLGNNKGFVFSKTAKMFVVRKMKMKYILAI